MAYPNGHRSVLRACWRNHNAIAPHTGADFSALLVNFLVYFGNALGNSPHAIAEAARHGTNLDVLVGETAKVRKASSRGHVHEFFKRVYPAWTETRNLGGLFSGEGPLDLSGMGQRRLTHHDEEQPRLATGASLGHFLPLILQPPPSLLGPLARL